MRAFVQIQPVLITSLQQNGANLVTVVRILLLFVVVFFAVSGIPSLAWVALPLAITVIWMDWLDGVVARRFRSTTALGGVLDIIGDRIVENVWWITFAWLGLIPLWIPIIVVSRGFVTDGIRGYALSKGMTAFGENSMMKSRIGYWLVASRPSRGTYCAAKIIAFGTLFGLNALKLVLGPTDTTVLAVGTIALTATYLAVALCLIRGLPVVAEFQKLIEQEQSNTVEKKKIEGI